MNYALLAEAIFSNPYDAPIRKAVLQTIATNKDARLLGDEIRWLGARYADQERLNRLARAIDEVTLEQTR